jgi:CBS domain-containing protein
VYEVAFRGAGREARATPRPNHYEVADRSIAHCLLVLWLRSEVAFTCLAVRHVRDREIMMNTSARSDRVSSAMIRHPKTLNAASSVSAVRALLEDDHVGLVLVVEGDRLVTTIERSDLCQELSSGVQARDLGTLAGRTIGPDVCLMVAMQRMSACSSRRLAVTGPQLELLGLLCLKRSGAGFCSDDDVRARAVERAWHAQFAGALA